MMQRIAVSLARELRGPADTDTDTDKDKKVEQDQLTIALHRLLPSCNAPSGECRHQISASNSAHPTA
jgi:hypothetical protein